MNELLLREQFVIFVGYKCRLEIDEKNEMVENIDLRVDFADRVQRVEMDVGIVVSPTSE